MLHETYFDTVVARVPGEADAVVGRARAEGIHLRRVDADHVAVSTSEVTTVPHLQAVWRAFGVAGSHQGPAADARPEALVRDDAILTHPVFAEHRSETQLLRYLRTLSDRDYALDRGMIPLGSCTMKLNATAEMEPISWPGFADLHPFVPAEDAAGMIELVMAGMLVVIVKATEIGEVDLDDLRAVCAEHADDLAAIMVTYPSTHGVYEDGITELCDVVHAAGGQVYVDGANLNALLGHAEPGTFGGDVSHLNLHKTFCIPHGGGGPGVGPVAVAEHLVPFLPSHPLHPVAAKRQGIGAISAAPYGSAGILPIPFAYVSMMGAQGLTDATSVAVLSANYVAARLKDAFPVLYTGRSGLVAHECILDVRGITKETGVTVDDVAKRLVDYGFHAPTMSFPVAGTLMVEPTESEDLAELDRFCDAMLAIRAEIDQVAAGEWPEGDNPLVQAPHAARELLDWQHAYPVATGVFPTGSTQDKYFPPVGRIDQAYGDRNLTCSCPPIEAFA